VLGACAGDLAKDEGSEEREKKSRDKGTKSGEGEAKWFVVENQVLKR
jgi:hypothetical protein